MTFKEKLILRFKKSKAVGCILVWKDHRITEHIVTYEGDYIVIGNKRFTINKDKVFYRRGIPYFIYYANDPEPLPLDTKGTPIDAVAPIDPTAWKPSPIDSTDFQTAIDSKVIKEVLSASNEDQKLMMVVIMVGIIILAALGGLYYYLTEQFGIIAELIK